MEGDSKELRGWRLVEIVGGLALLAISAAFAYLLAPEEESTAYAVGAAIGSIAGGLLIGAALRWGWVRWGPGSAPVMAPALLLVAGGIAFVLALASLGREAKEGEEVVAEVVDSVGAAASNCPDPLPERIGDGLELAPLSAAMQRRIAAAQPVGGAVAEVYEFAEYEQVLRGRRFVALVTLLPLEGAGDAANSDDLIAGVTDAVTAQGASPTPTTIAGQPGIGYELGAEQIVVTSLDCHALFVNALSAEDAREVATAAVEDQL